ncbi:MAG: hypothetical protein GY761_11075 [Hyphomicrobiales bacterium]|nr:hypothetical protein [Hyphomicrobiales bacterium]
MSCYFGNMIARYNAAKHRLAALLASDTEIRDSEIADADRELDAAFEAIMQAEVRDSWQIQVRVRFIAEQINERCENQEIINRLTRQMLADVSEVCTETDPNYVNLLYQAG